MNKAIEDCEANITRLVDDLHVVNEAIQHTTCVKELSDLGYSKSITKQALASEYEKLRRLQCEQAITEVKQ